MPVFDFISWGDDLDASAATTFRVLLDVPLLTFGVRSPIKNELIPHLWQCVGPRAPIEPFIGVPFVFGFIPLYHAIDALRVPELAVNNWRVGEAACLLVPVGACEHCTRVTHRPR